MENRITVVDRHSKKLFGVALDPADDPWSLQLKRAWMMARGKDMGWPSACSDPYDAVTKSIADILEEQHIELAGKFPVPSWLGPKPEASDLPLVTAKNMGSFFDSGSLLEIVRQLQLFVMSKILPGMPIMIGIDHSATTGIISALAEKYGPENLSVVVLDRHFDAIPVSVRLAETCGTNPDSMTNVPFGFPIIPVAYKNQFCCGNFWSHLIDAGMVLPENLIFIGVADYPRQEIDSKGNTFRRSYLSFEERGCSFFPSWQFEGEYVKALTKFIHEKITTPYLYVSCDLDVGAFRCTHAARYMDGLGIDRENLLDLATIIRDACQHNSFTLVGFDIMEFNMHFLGVKVPGGAEDLTIPLVRDFIRILAM